MKEIKDDTDREIYHIFLLEESNSENEYVTQSNL